jgi:hypothetical protein
VRLMDVTKAARGRVNAARLGNHIGIGAAIGVVSGRFRRPTISMGTTWATRVTRRCLTIRQARSGCCGSDDCDRADGEHGKSATRT